MGCVVSVLKSTTLLTPYTHGGHWVLQDFKISIECTVVSTGSEHPPKHYKTKCCHRRHGYAITWRRGRWECCGCPGGACTFLLPVSFARLSDQTPQLYALTILLSQMATPTGIFYSHPLLPPCSVSFNDSTRREEGKTIEEITKEAIRRYHSF